MKYIKDELYINKKYKKIFGLVRLAVYSTNDRTNISILGIFCSLISLGILVLSKLHLGNEFKFIDYIEWSVLIISLINYAILMLIIRSRYPQKYGFGFSILLYFQMIILSIIAQISAIVMSIIDGNGKLFENIDQLVIFDLLLIPVSIICLILYAKLCKKDSVAISTQKDIERGQILSVVFGLSISFIASVSLVGLDIEMILWVCASLWIQIYSVSRAFMLIVTRLFFKDAVDLFKFYELASNMDPNEEYPFRKNK